MSTGSGCAHIVTGILVVWSSLWTLRSIVLSDSELSFLGCFGSTGVGSFDSFDWFVLGVLLSLVPMGLQSVNVGDLTMLAVCFFVSEGTVGESRYVPDTPILWKEVFLAACSGVLVLCCVSS